MAERARRTEVVRAAAPLRVGPAILVAVERTIVRAGRTARGLWAGAIREPVALVVRDAGGIRAYDPSGAAISVEPLRERVPELDALLSAAGPR